MDILKRHIQLDVDKEKAKLKEFCESNLDKRIGIVYGPKSLEDRYYLEHSPPDQLGFTALLDSLESLGFATIQVDPTSSTFLKDIDASDWLLLNMHGEYGEDGRLQGLLDYLGKPYSGSGVLASALGMHKVMFKRTLLGAGIPTPRFVCLEPPSHSRETSLASREIPIPGIMKPVSGGSSIGITVVHSISEVERFDIGLLIHKFGQFFVEEFISGRSLTVGVLELDDGAVTTPVIEIQADAEFYDAETKLDKQAEGLVTYALPTALGPELECAIRSTALAVHEMLGCSGFSRVDFILTPEKTALVLEINTTPGMSRQGNFATGCAALGLSYDETVLAVLRSCSWPKQ